MNPNYFTFDPARLSGR